MLTRVSLQKHRMRLGPDVYGRRHGITVMQSFAQSWMPLLPPVVALMVGRGLALGWPSYLLPAMRWVPPALPRTPTPVMGLAAGYGCLVLSAIFAVAIIPSYVRLWNHACPELLSMRHSIDAADVGSLIPETVTVVQAYAPSIMQPVLAVHPSLLRECMLADLREEDWSCR